MSYSVICIFNDISTTKQLATLLFLLSNKFDKSTQTSIGYLFFYQQQFNNSTTKQASDQLNFECVTHKFNGSPQCCLYVVASLVATCVVRKPISATRVWGIYKDTYAHTKIITCTHMISCYVHTHTHAHNYSHIDNTHAYKHMHGEDLQ